jgi:hypothetical protein
MKNIILFLSIFLAVQIGTAQETWNDCNSTVSQVPQPAYDSTFVLEAPSRDALQKGMANWVPASSGGASGIDDVLAEAQALTAYRVLDGDGQSFRLITSHGGIDFEPGFVSIGNVDGEYNAAKLSVDAVSSIMFFDGVDPVNFGINTSTPRVALDVSGNIIYLPTSGAPSSSSDTGIKGQIVYDASYIYICIENDTWVRSALTTW